MMRERITQRLAELKTLQASVEQEMAQIEQRRAYIVQELLRLQGAVQALEALGQDEALTARVVTLDEALGASASSEHV
jgi:multidrug resistance efflux pump